MIREFFESNDSCMLTQLKQDCNFTALDLENLKLAIQASGGGVRSVREEQKQDQQVDTTSKKGK